MRDGLIFFRASTGNHYEIKVRGEDYIPAELLEHDDGRVDDLGSEKSWDSLSEMTHDLKIEVLDFGSDVGD